MSERDVLHVLDVLDGAGVATWVLGGWGVDALVGQATRDHVDLDLVLDRRVLENAQAALIAVGFDVLGEQALPRSWLAEALIMGDAAGRVVDIHFVDLDDEPFADLFAPDPRWGGPLRVFTVGTVGGREVPCLSAELQLAIHQGHEPRDIDTHDVALISAAIARGASLQGRGLKAGG